MNRPIVLKMFKKPPADAISSETLYNYLISTSTENLGFINIIKAAVFGGQYTSKVGASDTSSCTTFCTSVFVLPVVFTYFKLKKGPLYLV